MFEQLQIINQRPEPFSVYTAQELWTDPHTAQQMLNYHLNPDVPLASRTPDAIDKTVAWLADRFDIGKGTRIADFGCGPGLYSSRLAQLGAQVTGIDFSANSINYAREAAAKKGLQIDYRVANYLDFNSDQRFDLILLIFCDYCALGPQQRSRLLQVFRRHLADGGSLFMDVCTLAGFERRQEQASYAFRQLDGFWSAEEYYGFLNTFKYDAQKVALDKYTLFAKDRSWEVYNWLQYFSLESLTAEFAANGLAVDEVYGNTMGGSFDDEGVEMGVVAKMVG